MVINGHNVYVKHHVNKNSEVNYLIIHGGPGEPCTSFRYFIEELCSYANVIEVDQRGCGRSETITKDKISVKEIVDDFEEIRKTLEINRWNVIGHSFGGFIALCYANKHPSSIDKIILENPAINLQDSLLCIIHNYYKYFLKHRNFKYIKGLFTAEISRDVVTMLDAVNAVPPHHKRCFWGNNLLNKEAEDLLNFSELSNEQKINCKDFFNTIKHDEYLKTNGWELLKRLKCNIIFLSGQYDKITNIIMQKKISRNKNIKFFKISDAGHYIHLANIPEMCSVIKNN